MAWMGIAPPMALEAPMQIDTATRRRMFVEAHAEAKAVHVVGENYSATFGLALRAAYSVVKAGLARIADIGREGTVDANWVYRNHVRAGGDIFPSVRIHTDYAASGTLQPMIENLSRSRRSGAISWKLQADRLYTLDGVNVTSNRGATRYLSTFDGKTAVFTNHVAFEAELRRRFPTGAELSDVLAAQREAEAEIDRRLRIEREQARLAQIEERRATLAVEAKVVEEKGQEKRDGLPLLKGSFKQVAWATRIRDRVKALEPKNPALKRGTTASYWIENYRNVLPRF